MHCVFSALTLLVGRQEGHPVCKKLWWGAGVVICLERGADLHMAQLMPLALAVSCFNKIQTGFTFLVPADPGSPGQRAVKRVCVCVVDASFRWPETRLGPLEPKDRRFPLPGMVGSGAVHSVGSSPSQSSRKVERRPRYDVDVLVAELPYERQSTAFEQFVAVNAEVQLCAVLSALFNCYSDSVL